MICVRKHVECQVFQFDEPLRGLNVLFGCMYLDDHKATEGISSTNLAKLHMALCTVRSLGVPCILAGDFNLTPDRLRSATTCLDELSPDVVVPEL